MNPKKNSNDEKNKKIPPGTRDPAPCFSCGKLVNDPEEGNHFGDEIICDSCQQEMVASLEAAWVKHSAFLDSALN